MAALDAELKIRVRFVFDIPLWSVLKMRLLPRAQREDLMEEIIRRIREGVEAEA